MKFDKINSWAKINLSLNVIQKLPNKYHKIESLITFVQVCDEIKERRNGQYPSYLAREILDLYQEKFPVTLS